MGGTAKGCDNACDNGRAGVALTSLRAGDVGIVCETCMDPIDAAMLRAMGLRPNATIRVCRLGEPCILEVFTGAAAPCEAQTGSSSADRPCDRPGGCSCRIGLARPLAERVMVLV
jgi:Fe2+ transport system protein FeoA